MKFTRRSFGQLVFGGAAMAALGSNKALSDEGQEARPMMDHGMGMRTDPAAKTQVAILYYPMALLFDYGPAEEIFRVTEAFNAFNVYSVGVDPSPMMAMYPKKIYADFSLADAPDPDVVVIPGGLWQEMKNRSDIKNWLQKAYDNGAILMAVCTGGYILAQYGFLDCVPVTGLQAQLEILKALSPKAKIIEGAPFIDAGQIITTAGAATSLDAALHVVRRLKGYDAARWVAEDYLDHNAWDRDFGGDPDRFAEG